MQTEMERLLAAKSDKSRDSDDAVALLESQLTAATHEILSKGKQVRPPTHPPTHPSLPSSQG